MIIFGFLLPLIGNVLLDYIAVATLTNRGHEESVSPKLSMPEFISKVRMVSEKFLGGDTLDSLNDCRRTVFRGCADQEMDMILVNAHLLKYPVIALFDFCTYLNQGLLAVRTPENREAILDWNYEVIMDLVRIMLGCSDREHTLIVP